ncbi:MAG: hypothetical protein ACRDL2_12055 [Gaiellaceae bacterium]
MSDELERRLREAGHRLPGPTDSETHIARSRVLGARQRRPRRLLPALAAAVLVAGAFGVGYAVAAGGKAKPKVVVKHVPARLDAGPGFLPAEGWTTQASATSATATSGNGIRIEATFVPASTKLGLPQRLLPLRLPSGGKVRHLLVHVGTYAIDATITFPSRPDAALLVAAREELGRLVVPSCPSARPVSPADVAAAIHYVLRWLPAHYPGPQSDLAGATATARRGHDMPRYGEAAADCGAIVASRSFEVDVVLPKIAKVSASLSQLTYFVAKTAQGWTVWERAR